MASFMVSWAQAKEWDYVPGEVLVKLRQGTDNEAAYSFLGKAHQDKNLVLENAWSGMNMYHFKTKAGQSVEQTIQQLRMDPNVEYAEPNYILRKASEVGIHEVYSAEEIHNYHVSGSYLTTDADIGVLEFWAFKQSQGQVGANSSHRPIIAVIDSGVDINHPVFQNTNSIWTNPHEIPNNHIDDDGNGYIDDVYGWNFVANNGSMYDDEGHGTHVAGIVLSVDQDIFHPSPVDSKVQIMPLKFLNHNGVGTTSNAIKAIYYAVNNGASVLNNSWGGPSYSAALHEAVIYSYNHGVSFVAAAGNAATNNDSQPMYPASLDVPNVISVAATTSSDYLASFSNYGFNSVGIGSPGVSIYSTLPNNTYGNSSGTSMAAPLVAGAAIQMKVESPNMLGYQIKSILFNQSQYVNQLAHKVYTEGKLNVNNAVTFAQGATVQTSQPAYHNSFNNNRELASAISGGGGCGTIAKIYRDQMQGPSTGFPETWYVLTVLGLLILPMIILTWLRTRSPENRRRFERFSIESDVRIRLGQRELVGSVSTISLGGAQVNTDALLDNGGIVSLTISSPDGQESLEVQGRVVWSEAHKAYGVEFKDTTAKALDQISGWTQHLKKT